MFRDTKIENVALSQLFYFVVRLSEKLFVLVSIDREITLKIGDTRLKILLYLNVGFLTFCINKKMFTNMFLLGDVICDK